MKTNQFLLKIIQEVFFWGLAGAAVVFLLFNLFPPIFAASVIVGDGLLVYATTTNATIQYRTYASTTNAFSDPASNAVAATVNISHIVLEGSPTSTEKIMATIDDQGTTGNNTSKLIVSRWSGTGWTIDWTSTLATSTRRGVDIAYYGNNGNAIIVYATSTASINGLAYRTWNGSTWSATSTLTLVVPLNGNNSYPVWVEAEGFAIATSSQKVVMGYSDFNGRIGASIWDGATSVWSVATSTGIGLSTRNNATRIFDVALETISGDALVAFGFRDSAGVQSMSCVANCSSWTANVVNTATHVDDADFVDLAAAPFQSNSIAMVTSCAVDNSLDDSVQAAVWHNTYWGSIASIDTATLCDTAKGSGSFPAAVGWYATNSSAATGTGFLLYNDAATANTIFRFVVTNSTGVWTASNLTTGVTGIPNAYRGYKVYSWPSQASAMVTTVGSPLINGLLANHVTENDATATNVAPAGNTGAEGLLQSAFGGFAAAFSFNNIVSPTLGQRDFRWYVNDANSANPSDPWPTGGTDLAENASITSSDSPPATNDIVRLRISATSTAATIPTGTSLTVQFQATASTDCITGSWTDVGAATTWALVNNAGVADGVTITRSLVASTVNENYNESNPSLGIPNPISIGAIGEVDWPILNNGAAAGTTYSFRLAQSDGTAFSAYTNCPQITTAASATATTDDVLRHGTWFNAGVEQEFFWAK